MTKNRTPTPVYLDPGMHSGLEVKGLNDTDVNRCVKVRTGELLCSTDCVLTFNPSLLGVHIVCLGWVIAGFIEMSIKNVFF